MQVTRDEQLRLFEQWARPRLTADAWRHVASVADYIQNLALAQGLDSVQAVGAAYLHDAAKGMTNKELLDRARAYGLHISECQHDRPGLLHGPVAAEEARRAFGISDALYDAVYWHTTGRPGWNLLGLALFLADFAEPLRTFPEAAEARRRLDEQGFIPALCYVALEKLIHVEKKASHDPTTATFYAWLSAANRHELA